MRGAVEREPVGGRLRAASTKVWEELDAAIAALREAEAFIRGFEDDELQDVKSLLAQVRAAIKAGEA